MKWPISTAWISGSVLLAGLSNTPKVNAQEFLKYPIEITAVPGAVNTPENDYAPVMSPDEKLLLFTGFGRTSASFPLLYSAGGSGLATGNPNPVTVENTSIEGAVSVAADGKTVAFAAHRSDAIGDVDLYIGELENGKIQNIENLGANVNTKGWESHPSLSADGTTLYFTSDRKGGHGRTDIWMTVRSANGWSDPTNLGENVNTGKDERSPFITPDGGTLYFASKGHDGYGGYDIFMSVKKGNRWQAAVNLGPKINTDKDELFLFAPKSAGSFYFSSSRIGGKGGLDIYSGSPNIYGSGMFSLNLSLIDSTTGQPLPGDITIFDLDNGKNIASMTTTSLDSTVQQYLPVGHRFRIDARVRDVTKSLTLDQTAANAEVDRKIIFGNIVLKLVDFGKYDIPFFVSGYYRPNTLSTLDELVAEGNDLKQRAPYIENIQQGSKKYQEYATYAQTVSSLFSTLSTSCVEDIFPSFRDKKLPGEVIEIRVTGYADPNPLTGNYIESSPTSFEDTLGHRITIQPGETLDNTKLSGLRALYSAKYLDSIMSAASKNYHDEYGDLKNDNRIVFRCIGASVANMSMTSATDPLARKRKILVEVIRRQAMPGDELLHEVAAK